MKPFNHLIILCFTALIVLNSCRSTRKIGQVIAAKDSVTVKTVVPTNQDSINTLNLLARKIKTNKIDFKTFSAKIKIDYEDNSKGRTPDLVANVKMIKDSVIWMSISATILNIEAFRIFITKDSVILMDKQNKEVSYRSLDYLQEITQIPFDLYTLQDFILGNPVFLDSNYLGYKKTPNAYLVNSNGIFFKHLLTLDVDTYLVQHSKLDDVDDSRNRTADVTYDAYENTIGKPFALLREITILEKSKIDIKMKYKSYEFNKDLTITFNVPKNYKRR